MKKLLFLLGGVISLTACSDEVFNDVENESINENHPIGANSFNDNDSGYIDPATGVKAPGKEYFSPWDIWYRDEFRKQPVYLFWNGNAEGGGEPDLAYSPYELHITPYVGLAYFDGSNDGIYTDLNTSLVTNFLTGNYPNLYDNNNPLGFPQEVGALIKADPIKINPLESLRFEHDSEHLPSTGLSFMGGPQIPTTGFMFTNGQVNGLEETLLREFGKVFFYGVEVYENGNLIDSFVMHPNVETLHTGLPHWKPAEDVVAGQQMVGYDPATGGTVDLHYYENPLFGTTNPTDWRLDQYNSNDTCNSHEVVFKVPPTYNTHTVVTGSVTKTLYMGFTMHPFYLWQASSLDLRWI
jgi:hypothetical protein